MNINYDRLRKDLVEYFGTALSVNPCAIFDVNKVQNASKEELKNIAVRNGFKLSDYVIVVKRYF